MPETDVLEDLKQLEKEAKSAEKKALKKNEKSDYLLAAKRWNVLAETYSENNIRDKAAYAYQRSAYMYKLNGDFWEQAASLYSVSGLMYELMDNHEESAPMWKESAEIYAKLKKNDQAADIYLTAAQILLDEGEKSEAADIYFRSAETYFLAKQPIQSAQYYKKAGKIYEAIKDWQSAGKSFSMSARTYENIGENGKASDLYARSARMFKLARETGPYKKEEKIEPAPPPETPAKEKKPFVLFPPERIAFLKKALPVAFVAALIISVTILYFMQNRRKTPTTTVIPLEEQTRKEPDVKGENPEDLFAEEIDVPEAEPESELDTTALALAEDSQSIPETELVDNVQSVEGEVKNELPQTAIIDTASLITLTPEIEPAEETEPSPPPEKKSLRNPKRIPMTDVPQTPTEQQRQRHYYQSILDYKEVIQKNPNDAMAYMEIGIIYQKLGALNKAIQNLKTAIRLNPDNHRAYYHLGFCYKETNQLDLAIESFQNYVEVYPNNEQVHFELGNLYSLRNRVASAIIEFEKVIRLNPKNALAYTRLGGLYEIQEMYEQARVNYEKATQLNPEDIKAHSGLAWVYEKLGMDEKAETQREIVKKLRNQ
jgi:tetratricopeptide (TPR) repeat protein